MLRLGPRPRPPAEVEFGDLVKHKHFKRFLVFYRANPWVYDELVVLARKATVVGRHKASIQMFWEVIRWERILTMKDEDSSFKLNDHYRSLYARLIMAKEKDLKGIFEIRGYGAEPAHTCHAYGCGTVVPPKMFMCLPHWRQVPKALQREIWRHYQPGQENRKVAPTEEYLDVTKRAQVIVAKYGER